MISPVILFNVVFIHIIQKVMKYSKISCYLETTSKYDLYWYMNILIEFKIIQF
jgi:hypothetical protein